MRTVLITGATRGLGLAIARACAGRGYRALCTGRQETTELSALMADHPGRVMFRPLDLSDLAAIPAFIKAQVGEFGPLWGLVNNARQGRDGLLATQHGSDIAALLTVNLHAPILLAKYGCRSMLTQGGGRIINISSIVASTGFSGLSVYGATKAGLEGFTRSLSRELGRARVTVNCVAPGYMETDMTAGLAGRKLDQIRRRAPLGLPQPDAVATAVLYLLSDEAAMMTGSIITVDGGSTA